MFQAPTKPKKNLSAVTLPEGQLLEDQRGQRGETVHVREDPRSPVQTALLDGFCTDVPEQGDD